MKAFSNGPSVEQVDQAIVNETPLSVTVNGSPVTFLVADKKPFGQMVDLVGTVLHNEERIPCRLLLDPEHRSGMIHIP